MLILKIELQNSIHTIEKINGAYLVESKFTDDASSGEIFEFDSLLEAQNHVNNEIKEYTRLMDDLHNTLLLALNLSQKLNLDVSSDINGLLDNF
jgi:uncharacterized protein YeeX (DUF496 family)